MRIRAALVLLCLCCTLSPAKVKKTPPPMLVDGETAKMLREAIFAQKVTDGWREWHKDEIEDDCGSHQTVERAEFYSREHCIMRHNLHT